MDMPSSLPFSEAFDHASGVVGERLQNPCWRLKEWFWGSAMRNAVREVKTFGDAVVAQATQKKSVQSAADPSCKNLIYSLMDHIDDPRTVADAAMNYLSAGALSKDRKLTVDSRS